MNKYLLILLIGVFAIISCAGTDSQAGEPGSEVEAPKVTPEPPEPGTENMKLDFKVEGLGGNVVCKMIGIYGNQNFLVDSVMSNADGSFTFARDTNIYAGIYYIVFPENKFFTLILDANQVFTMETKKGDLVASMNVKGSLDNQLYYQNQQFETDFNERFKKVEKDLKAAEKGTDAHGQLKKQRDDMLDEREAHIQHFQAKYPHSFFTQFKIAGQNPKLKKPKKPNGDLDTALQVYHYRKEYWDNVDLNDGRLLRTPVFHNKMENYITKITPQTADSVVKYADWLSRAVMKNKELFKYAVNWIATNYQKPKFMGDDAVYVHMIDNFFTPQLAFWAKKEDLDALKRDADKKRVSLVGNQGQDLRCKDFNGNYVNLFDSKKPVLLIYFFDPECTNCQKETPELHKLYLEMIDDVDVFAMCTHHKLEICEYYKKKEGLTWTNVHDPDYESRYYLKYYFDHTPGLYVLGKDRKIIAKDLKAFQLRSVIKKELKREVNQ